MEVFGYHSPKYSQKFNKLINARVRTLEEHADNERAREIKRVIGRDPPLAPIFDKTYRPAQTSRRISCRSEKRSVRGAYFFQNAHAGGENSSRKVKAWGCYDSISNGFVSTADAEARQRARTFEFSIYGTCAISDWQGRRVSSDPLLGPDPILGEYSRGRSLAGGSSCIRFY